MSQNIQNYLQDLQKLYSDTATEYTYRTPFENYLQKLFVDLKASKIEHEGKTGDGNKPDFLVAKRVGENTLPLLYIEVKNIGVNLDTVEKSNQATRYFGYDNLIISDYLEFRFYRHGQPYGEPIKIAQGNKKERKIESIVLENGGKLERRMKDFVESHKEQIKSASHLAKIMGGKAQRIRDNLREMMQDEENKYTDIRNLFTVFKNEILHDLSYEDFADLYAQTLVYGLFVARYHDKTPESFSRSEARDLIPKSNPLLAHFFDHIAGAGYEKRLEYIVDELCEVFAHADVHALMHNIYKKETHDPVIHFYEDFLSEYDTSLRMQRGVFYTPAPVVNFIVRAIDDLLKSEFGIVKGLSDSTKIPYKKVIKQDKKGKNIYETRDTHRVQILDPATGTGTFLNEIIKQIHTSVTKNGTQAGQWNNQYVNDELLPRLHGFELMMASYTIAHLKLGLTLAETGIDDIQKRLQVYLTNSLEEAVSDRNIQRDIFGLGKAITQEGAYADEVKQDKPVMIVVGNPPYSVSSSNKSPWIEKLMKDYKKNLNERNIQPLSDDYIKFIRFGEHLIEKNSEGILAYISNNSFVDGIIHRQMRQQLRDTFDSIYIVNLHGDSRKGETTPDGGKDENVFDIMQGVSLSFFVKHKSGTTQKKGIFHYDLYGKRQEKYDFLEKMNIGDIQWNDLSKATHGYFVDKNEAGKGEYDKGVKVSDLFVKNSMGIATGKDAELVSYCKLDLENKFLGNDNITYFSYKPYDNRYTIFDNSLLQRARFKFMMNYYRKQNYGLNLVRQSKGKGVEAIISKSISNRDLVTNHTYSFPLYLYSETENLDGVTKTPNLDGEIIQAIEKSLGMSFVFSSDDDYSDIKGNFFTPEDILDYIYAVLHSPKYRETYKEFLKIDFPRVPYPSDKKLFGKLVQFGKELRELHLLESAKLQDFITTFPESGENTLEKKYVKFIEKDEKTGDVYLNETQYFGNVPKQAWEFYIGGYQPAQKWLKDRAKDERTLSWEDIEHYQKMIVSLSETIRIMNEIEKVFEV